MRRHKFLLLVSSFLVLLAAFVYLTAWLPPVFRHGFAFSKPANEIALFHRTGANDLASVRLRLDDGHMYYHRRDVPVEAGVAHTAGTTRQMLSEFSVRDPDGNLRWVDLPTDWFPLLIEERYAVWVSNEQGKIICKDLEQPNLESSQLDLLVSTKQYGTSALSENRILITDTTVPPPSTQPDFNRIIEVDDGQLREVARWLNSNVCYQVGDELWEFDLTEGLINKRSVMDGKTLETVPFPKQLGIFGNGKRFNLQLVDKILIVWDNQKNESSFFLVPELTPLSVEGKQVYPSLLGTEGRTAVFYEMVAGKVDRFIGWDVESDACSWEYRPANECTFFRPVGKDLLIGYPGKGYTFDIVDRASGQLKKRMQPFGFAVWWLPSLFIGWFVWLIALLKGSIATPAARIVFSFSVTLLSLIGYMAFWRLIPGPPQVPLFNYCHGMFLGLAIAGFIWLLFGRERLSLRYLPLLGIFVLQLFLCGFVFSNNYRFAAEAFVSTIVPSSLAALPMFVIRWVGFRFSQCEDPANDANDAEVRSSSFPIRDLFIASFAFALFFAVLRPAMAMLNLPTIDPVVIYGSLTTIVGTICVLMLTQANHPVLRLVSSALVTTLFAILVLEALVEFSLGHPFIFSRMDMEPVVFRVIATALVTQFLIQLAYCASGWRMTRGRKSSVPASLQN